MKPSKKSRDMIGKEISYELDGRVVSGVVQDVRRSNSTIVHAATMKESTGVQFLLRTEGGGADFWTVNFPDASK